MFISTKANHSLNSSNPAHGLKQQNLPGLLIAALTTPALANTKSTTENLNFTEDSSTLLPSIPPAQLFNDVYNNESAIEGESGYVVTPRISSEIPIWLIPCYGVIFFFAIVGNLLVISTLVQNRRMRTITNVFLLNLAISDMLLGVLCMPVTLVGTLLRHFIFGEFFCKLIQFSQAASVAVSSWTLVAISCERYYAICHPLRSRTWQTINHAYRIIGFIWFGSIICMTPIAIFSQLIPTSRQGLRKCREQWPEDTIAYERSYNIFLDLALLVLPLFILCVAYILITRTLYVGMRAERALIFGGYATSNTPVKQHVGTSLPAISTVTGENAATATTTLPPSVLRSFNLKMSLRCHRKPASVGSCAIRSDGQDIVSEMQSDMGYHQHRHHQHEQQQRQQEQQIKYYDDSGGGGDVLHKSFSIASTKTPQSLFGLRVLPCVDKVEQQKEMQPPTPPQQQQQLLLLQTNIARHLHGYNSNGNHTANNSEGAILFANHHQPHQQNLVTLRANLPQYHSNQLNQQQQKQNLLSQVSLQSQQKHLIGDRRKTYSTPSIRIKESTLRRSNETKNLESKKRVVKMLFVLVLEFFICWTPLYVINTVAMFIGPAIYEYIDYTSICFFQLLAYSSSCCNPITYCFMNASFRRAFLDTFKGLHLSGNSGGAGGASVGIWHSRQKGTDCGVGGGSRSGAHLPALVSNDSIALANNAIIASNNTSMHGSQHPQRN